MEAWSARRGKEHREEERQVIEALGIFPWSGRLRNPTRLLVIFGGYFLWSETTSEVLWLRATAGVLPSGDHRNSAMLQIFGLVENGSGARLRAASGGHFDDAVVRDGLADHQGQPLRG